MATEHKAARVARTATTTDLKHIVVAVDAEGLADHALRAALDLARKLGAKVEVVHAVGSALPHWEYVDDPRAAARNAGLVTTAWKAATAHVERVLADVRHEGVSARDLVRVIAGPAAKVILDEAQRVDADLIMLGTHRRRGMMDFGSTVRAVLAKAPKGVWVQTQPVRAIQRILVPVDLSADSLLALSQACALAKSIGASVRAVQVFQSAEYMIPAWPDYPDYGGDYVIEGVRRARLTEFEKAMAEFDWRGVPHQADFVDGDPIETILDLSRSCDLVALGTHGRTGFASMLLGNVAYTVLKRCDKPVWAIRHPERQFLT
jgi:nucleotide-binding universal stress UspA family protein